MMIRKVLKAAGVMWVLSMTLPLTAGVLMLPVTVLRVIVSEEVQAGAPLALLGLVWAVGAIVGSIWVHVVLWRKYKRASKDDLQPST